MTNLKESNLRHWMVGLIFTLLMPNSSWAVFEGTCETLDDGSKPIYYIFFVHGLAGNTETFGVMGEALTKHMPQVNPCFDYKYLNVSYETGHKQMTAYDFMIELGLQMEGKLSEAGRDLNEKDKISLIAHSQGGIVSTLWYYLSLITRGETNGKEISDWRPIARRVDAIITVGTPFWGSKMAHFGMNFWRNIPGVEGLLEKAGMGLGELRTLSHGSDLTENFHHTLIDLDQRGILQRILRNFRPLSIAGVTSYTGSPKMQFEFEDIFSLKTLTGKWAKRNVVAGAERRGFGAERYESDIAVLVPSARPNFYYYKDGENPRDNIRFEDFKRLDITEGHGEVPFVILETIHASPNAESTYDMVALPKVCLSYYTCDHPTYQYVLEHLSNCDDPNIECNEGRLGLIMKHLDENTSQRFHAKDSTDLYDQMRGFTLELNVQLPAGYTNKVLDQIQNVNWARNFFSGNDEDDKAVLKVVHFRRKNKDQITVPYVDLNSEDMLSSRNLPLLEHDPRYEIFIGRDVEKLSAIGFVSSSDEFSGESHNELRIHLSGIVVPEKVDPMLADGNTHRLQELRQTGFPIEFEVVLPGLKRRNVQAIVNPTYSTYLDIQMTEIP